MGALDGAKLGAFEGAELGANEGVLVGVKLGALVGTAVLLQHADWSRRAVLPTSQDRLPEHPLHTPLQSTGEH